MITFLRGTLDCAGNGVAIVDVNGIGYEACISASCMNQLPPMGHPVKLFVYESVAMYGGNVTLYGFLTEEERDLFTLLKEEVPGAGAKKALDYLDKITSSIHDFKNAIINKDIAVLTGAFGFTKKTADKLVAALKDKIGEAPLPVIGRSAERAPSRLRTDAVQGLVALGYKESHAREIIDKLLETEKAQQSLEQLLRSALRYL
ncbi:MAG: hypothetical protein A2219_05950 [Elusimicrobia bacterium RIFOXYA2_FULL_50_26]|nr:MAG: hypothetical protein A2219_05950 [Elusimicrobia bacterium RIFOXYA2_FULL_50_26]OGS24841.1 MAG: hypothetical protein A2314_02170 [Elusimicrobia bacterium RIFOXYB2_FULL_50_12]